MLTTTTYLFRVRFRVGTWDLVPRTSDSEVSQANKGNIPEKEIFKRER
jgi:hypothetical protein